MKYPVHEMFSTFQGEGHWSGRRAFFIRLFGCPVQCPWCDSAGTWHKDWIPKHVHRMTADELADAVLEDEADFVVITGGEPAVHDLTELIHEIHQEAGAMVALETSGAFIIKGFPDWVTLSPKKWKLPVKEAVQVASEFKIIVEEKDDIAYYMDKLMGLGMMEVDDLNRPVWLHPEWGHREDPVVLGAISDAVKAGGPFRAGWQLHKLYQVDARDSRARPLVPLGGNLMKGY